MKARQASLLALLLILALALWSPAQPAAAAAGDWSGGVNILSVPPERICVGDSVTFDGAASSTYIGDLDGSSDIPLAPLEYTRVDISARHGTVTPNTFGQPGDGFYFSFTYKAAAPGPEVITLNLNNGLATYQERFEVQEKCDYDAFLLSTLHFTADMDGERFESITHVTGTGQMKRDRQGSPFLQGDGVWHLEEKILSKPSHCVSFYAPPLILSGPFELDGRMTDEGDALDVILSFQPKLGEATYHGKSVCVDENSDTGYGWGYVQGGDPAMAARIQTDFPVDGGARTVALEGAGMDVVQSAGVVDYSAVLTLITR